MNRLIADDLLLTQSIYITDKFGFDETKMLKSTNNTETPFIVANYQDVCINSYGKNHLMAVIPRQPELKVKIFLVFFRCCVDHMCVFASSIIYYCRMEISVSTTTKGNQM
jgi:hypothetical protein